MDDMLEYERDAASVPSPEDGVPQRPVTVSTPADRDIPQHDGTGVPQTPGTDHAAAAAPRGTSRWTRWRDERRRTAKRRQADLTTAKASRDAQTAAQQRAAVHAAQVARSTGRRTTGPAVLRDEQIAPIPGWMQVLRVWLTRTFGALPEYAPLIVSGFFTVRAATDEPIEMNFAAAVFITLALEGGLWKLGRMLNAHLLEGDSTISLRVSIFLWIGIIAGFIYWHADHVARGRGLSGAMVAWDWVPALVSAGFCVLGVRMTTHQARFAHRVRLREERRMDIQVPKFATAAWLLCGLSTFSALRHAVKFRIQSPLAAIEDLRTYRASGRPPVWPVPPGFEYVGGQYVPIEGYAEHGTLDAPERDVLSRDGQNVPQNAPLDVPRDVPQTVPDRPGPSRATRQDGTAGRPTNVSVPLSPAMRDGDGSRTDVPQNGGTGDGRENVLKYADHLIAVTERFPDWQTRNLTVTEVVTAIAAHRQAIDGGSFNSRSIGAEVRRQLIGMRFDGERLAALKDLAG